MSYRTDSLKAAARAYLDQIGKGERPALAPNDRIAMLEALSAAGIKIDPRRGDAYVATRFDAEWDESLHPRGEHGMFGAGGEGGTVGPSGKVIGKSTPTNPSGKPIGRTTPNPAAKLTPAMKAKGASAYAREMSKSARGSAGHAAAAAAHQEAAAQQRALGNSAKAERHAAAATAHEQKATATSPAARGPVGTIISSGHQLESAAKAGAAQASAGYNASAWDHTEQGPTVGFYRNGSSGVAESRTTFGSMAEAHAFANAYNKSAKEKDAKVAAGAQARIASKVAAKAASKGASEHAVDAKRSAALAELESRKAERAAKAGASDRANRAAAKAAEHAQAAQKSAQEANRTAVGTDATAKYWEAAEHAGAARAASERAGKAAVRASLSPAPTSPTSVAYNREGKAIAVTVPGRTQESVAEKLKTRFPVGPKVVSGRAAGMMNANQARATSGTVIGHHPTTGHPEVRFANGEVRHVNPSREYEGLNRVQKYKGE
jgi:hypothetical protein